MPTTDQKTGDPIRVAGGVDLPDHLDRFADDDRDVPGDDLTRRIYTLMQLHPDVDLNFRQDDLDAMDDATKRLLISDFHRILNVAPFKSSSL